MLLQNLTKEELIRTIANMHDVIQDWDNGYGLSDKDSKALKTIGSECCDYCSENECWEVPSIEDAEEINELILFILLDI